MHRTVQCSLVLLALIVTSASSASAQITAATISGTIKDDTGGVLPGADIVARNLETGISRSTVSNGDGAFTLPGLPPGKYEVRTSLPGFSTNAQNVELTVAQQAGLTITLKVGSAQETVTVIAGAVLVDTQSSSLSALVPEKTIEELPLNGRNYISLATLQPGIVNFTEKSGTSSSTRGVQLNINGMGGRSNSFLIDGANMKGYAGIATVTAADSTLGVDTIREFRVVTNAFSADYGRAMGGVISIATKSGSNSFHGSTFEFFRDSRFDAPNYFDVGGEPPPFKRNQFGVSVGGPIRKNRVFFFAGYERLQEDLGITLTTTVPSAAVRAGAVNAAVKPYLDLYPLPNGTDLGGGIAQYLYVFNRPTRENFAQGRIDLQATDKHAIFLRHTLDKAHQLLPAGTVSFPQFQTDSTSDNQFFTAEDKWVATPSVLNTARASVSVLKFEQLPANTLQSPLSFFSQAPYMGSIGVAGLTSLGNDSTTPSTNNVNYYTYSDDITYTHGKHLLKTGVLVEHAFSSKQTTTNSRGAYTFASLTTFLAGTARQFQGVLPGSILVRERPNTLVGAYVQDDLRVNDRLTLNLGARYETYSVPSEKNGFDAYLPDLLTSSSTVVGGPFVNPSRKNFAPRVGFAWDAAGDGHTAIRGGTGIYYDTDGTFNSSFGIAAFTPPFAPTVNLQNPTFPAPVFPASITTAGALALRTLDYNVEQPRAWTYNLNLQRELGRDMVATIGYAGSHGYHLVSAIEGNPVVPVTQADGTLFFPAGAPRRNPAWTSIDLRTSNGRSTYNSLQAMLQKRFTKGYQVQLSYTLSKTMDNTVAQLNVDSVNTSVYAQNPYDPDADWAPAPFDIRHVFAANATWEIPAPPGRNPLLTGWQINTIVSLRSGLPFSPSISTSNWSRDGNTSGEDRPNVQPGVDPASLITGDPNHWFDTSVFSLQPAGFLGNTPRDWLRGPGFANVDLSFVKNQTIAATTRLQLRLEIFNLFNRANFGTPTRTVFAGATANDPVLPTAGQITRTVNSSRQLQFSAKVMF
ncbi:MAG TPA: carboxypeptidase regulatory-like domain-containing protein [Vicinamibacterales bacterium]|nr:carboxypeptidase regulatory-like domain-containing protein [Vicinamibacterales bacterium]